MIDHQIHRDLRIDGLSTCTKILRRVPHRSQINNRGNTGKVLHQDAGWPIGNFLGRASAIVEPGFERHDIVSGHRGAILIAQHIFQEHFQGGRQAGDIAKAVLSCGIEGVVSIILTVYGQGLAGLETVEGWHEQTNLSFACEYKRISGAPYVLHDR